MIPLLLIYNWEPESHGFAPEPDPEGEPVSREEEMRAMLLCAGACLGFLALLLCVIVGIAWIRAGFLGGIGGAP